MSEATNDVGPALTLEFDAPELYVSDLGDLVRDLSSMVAGITSGLPAQVRVRWVVRHISMASPLTIQVTPTARLRNRAVDAPVDQLPEVAVTGVMDLLGGVRPRRWDDGALGHLRGLYQRADRRGARVSLSASDGSQVEVTASVARTVDTILEPSYHAYGTVEGLLELINAHGREPLFGVYDELTGRRVDCAIGNRIPLAEAAAAITHRVSVEGEISYRADGNIVRIAADRLVTFPPDESLPSARDVLGILSA